jgi:hypothetical protein
MPANPVFLSFCIPTYNRASRVFELVKLILSCPDDDIEIVVLDNGSTDNTLALLRSVTDHRLQVYCNGVNRGALFNMVNVLAKGRGEYLVFSTDQDHTDTARISSFKAFLKSNPNVSCGYCSFDEHADKSYRIVEHGYDCVATIAYKGRHPTGYFFQGSFLKQIHLVENFSDFDFVDLFPLEFAFAEIGAVGDGAIFQERLFCPNTGQDVVAHKSSTTVGTSPNAFFAPKTRLKLAVSYSSHISTLPLPETQKSRLAVQVFGAELVAATFGYRSVLSNEKLCIHYGMERRQVSQSELFGIAIWFIRSYLALSFLGRISYSPRFMCAVLWVVGRRVASRFR